MALKPLEQWICDSCGELIEQPKDGYVEWLSETGKTCGAFSRFRIVHHKPASPRKSAGCQFGAAVPDGHVVHDLPLRDVVGERALGFLLPHVDVGEHFQDRYEGPQVADLREWVELTKRLIVPGYEEARQYLGMAEADGFTADWSPSTFYRKPELDTLSDHYRGRI